MNAKILDFFKHQIHDDPHSTPGMCTFDTWGSGERSYIYTELKDKKLIIIDYEVYSIHWRKGGGCGMGESPDSILVRHINLLDAEVIVRDGYCHKVDKEPDEKF